MVRWQLKRRGVKTTTLDSEGIETEIGLSALLEKGEVDKIFGDDLVFDLRAIFDDAFGPNLRNAVAHGLLDPDEMHSTYVVYAWWWYLKLVLDNFLEVQRKTATTEGDVADLPESGDHN